MIDLKDHTRLQKTSENFVRFSISQMVREIFLIFQFLQKFWLYKKVGRDRSWEPRNEKGIYRNFAEEVLAMNHVYLRWLFKQYFWTKFRHTPLSFRGR